MKINKITAVHNITKHKIINTILELDDNTSIKMMDFILLPQDNYKSQGAL